MSHRVALVAFALCSSAPAIIAQAPAHATRADGSAVILYPNGTWKPDSSAPANAATAGATFSTPASATASLDIGRGVTLHYNPAKWKQTQTSAPGRLQLEHVDGDGYAMIIAERLQIPLLTLKNVALMNARKSAPDIKVVVDEPRKVNGLDVQVLQFQGTAQGIPFRWYGYYFTGKQGSFQILTYTGESLFDGFKPDFEDLLNGFQVEQP